MELILGHNQFIGISHISEEQSRERNQRFSTAEGIYKIVEYAADLGFTGMIIESHPRMIDFLKYRYVCAAFSVLFFAVSFGVYIYLCRI